MASEPRWLSEAQQRTLEQIASIRLVAQCIDDATLLVVGEQGLMWLLANGTLERCPPRERTG